MIVLPRSAWSAPSNEPVVKLYQRTHIVFHHSVAADNDDTPNVWESLSEILDFMRRLKGMRPELFKGREPDVPYNFVAFLAGFGIGDNLVLVEGIGLDRRGAHSARANTPHLGVCFAGNFMSFNDRLDDDVQDVVKWFDLVLGRQLPVLGHRDVKNTLCPGDSLYQAVKVVKSERDAWIHSRGRDVT